MNVAMLELCEFHLNKRFKTFLSVTSLPRTWRCGLQVSAKDDFSKKVQHDRVYGVLYDSADATLGTTNSCMEYVFKRLIGHDLHLFCNHLLHRILYLVLCHIYIVSASLKSHIFDFAFSDSSSLTPWVSIAGCTCSCLLFNPFPLLCSGIVTSCVSFPTVSIYRFFMVRDLVQRSFLGHLKR